MLNYFNPRGCWWEYQRKWSKGNKLLLHVHFIPYNLCFLWNSDWNYFWRIDEFPLANIRLISLLFSHYISNWFLLSIKSLANELESQCGIFVRLKKEMKFKWFYWKKFVELEKFCMWYISNFYVYIYST